MESSDSDSDSDSDDEDEYVAAILAIRRRAAAAAKKRQKSGPQGKKRRPMSFFSWSDHVHRLSERDFKLRYRHRDQEPGSGPEEPPRGRA